MDESSRARTYFPKCVSLIQIAWKIRYVRPGTIYGRAALCGVSRPLVCSIRSCNWDLWVRVSLYGGIARLVYTCICCRSRVNKVSKRSERGGVNSPVMVNMWEREKEPIHRGHLMLLQREFSHDRHPYPKRRVHIVSPTIIDLSSMIFEHFSSASLDKIIESGFKKTQIDFFRPHNR